MPVRNCDPAALAKRRIMLVVVAVSSTKTSLLRPSSSWASNQSSRSALTSGRCCSAAWSVFFVRDVDLTGWLWTGLI
ncbi:hypothetical protein M2440_003044 [Methylorubrum extorquens]|nr:hypothetical protein [Methylorubrum extorquens]